MGERHIGKGFMNSTQKKEGRTMTYKQRFWIFALMDSFIILTAVLYGTFLVNAYITVGMTDLVLFAVMFILVSLFFSMVFKLYRKAWEYASIEEWFVIFKVVSCSIVTVAILQSVLMQNVFVRLLVAVGLLNLTFMGGARFCWRIFRDSVLNSRQKKTRILIVGAGSAGRIVAEHLRKNVHSKIQPVGFMDDDPAKQHLHILGLPVLGETKDIQSIAEVWGVDEIILAIPSLPKSTLSRIYKRCASTNCTTKIVPGLDEILSGKAPVSEFRDVQVEDLLGRDPVQLDLEKIEETITNQVVLITGAGGSIGSEICRQLAKFKPRQMILLGHGEMSIYHIEMELIHSEDAADIEIITEIADIQDFNKMMYVMGNHLPDLVFHAAAHKHVPLMERNPDEAVKNNLIGTMNVAKAANWHGVKTFVLISSDKAVHPTSVMGATKRLAEMVVQNMNQNSKTKFVVVRFGNVLGSRGSVIPLFKKQIQAGGPVTVTHPDMVRYFMTIPEASRLCIQASVLAGGGEIFVLDMGEPVKIIDLAKKLITLSGYTLEDIEIQYTGIRTGEKLVEELLDQDEMNVEQVFQHIYIGNSQPIDMKLIDLFIQEYAMFTGEQLKEQLFMLTDNQRERAVGLVMEG